MREDDIRAFLESDYVRVVRAVAVACGDWQRAEDAVQDAIVDVWSKRREVNDLAAWTTTAALNRARSRWRTAAAERRAFERLALRTVTDIATAATTPSHDARVAEALAGLPRKQREVVALHYVLDMSVAEIASRLNIADGTVKVHLHRGRAAMRVTFGDINNEEEVDHVRP